MRFAASVFPLRKRPIKEIAGHKALLDHLLALVNYSEDFSAHHAASGKFITFSGSRPSVLLGPPHRSFNSAFLRNRAYRKVPVCRHIQGCPRAGRISGLPVP